MFVLVSILVGELLGIRTHTHTKLTYLTVDFLHLLIRLEKILSQTDSAGVEY